MSGSFHLGRSLQPASSSSAVSSAPTQLNVPAAATSPAEKEAESAFLKFLKHIGNFFSTQFAALTHALTAVFNVFFGFGQSVVNKIREWFGYPPVLTYLDKQAEKQEKKEKRILLAAESESKIMQHYREICNLLNVMAKKTVPKIYSSLLDFKIYIYAHFHEKDVLDFVAYLEKMVPRVRQCEEALNSLSSSILSYNQMYDCLQKLMN
jgi:hypothetical protein